MEVSTDVTPLSNVTADPSGYDTTSSSGSLTTYYLYTAIGCLGVLDNFFVIVVISMHKPMRKRMNNLFILHQSVVDCVGSLVFLIGLSDRNAFTSLTGVAAEWYCKLWKAGSLLWGCYVASTLNLLAITLERYAELVHPVWHRSQMSTTKAYIIMILAWVLGVIYCLLFMVPTSGIVRGFGCMTLSIFPSAAHRAAACTVTVLLTFTSPVIIMVFVYVKIALSMRSRVRIVSEVTENVSKANRDKAEKMAKVRYNIYKTMVTVSVCFLICWSPNEIWLLMYGYGYPLSFYSPYYYFSTLMVTINPIINPVVYIMQYEQFQTAVKAVVLRIPH